MTAAVPQFLPWQLEQARAWLGNRERFAHAWLIHGLAGIGKTQFALAAAAGLLCESPKAGLACGACAACQWVALGNHPDLRRIRPDAVAALEGEEAEAAESTTSTTSKKAPSKDIRVEQLRSLYTWFNTATHRGGYRVAVLYPAHALNQVSANALLKVLEEPPEHTVFLLVSDAPDRLLPTLVSRCRRLPLAVPGRAQSAEWLEHQGIQTPDLWLDAAGGAPLKALDAAQSGEAACPQWLELLARSLSATAPPDPGPTADALEKLPVSVWVDVLQRWFVDLMLATHNTAPRYYPGLSKLSQQVGCAASPRALADAARWLAQQRALADHPLNAKLLAHTAAQRIIGACARAQTQLG